MEDEKKKKRSKKKKNKQGTKPSDDSNSETSTDAQIPLEYKVKELLDANNLHRQKEATFNQTIRDLKDTNDSLIRREASLKETITELQNENKSHIEKEAGLETKIVQLQRERDSWLQKEASLKENITDLQKEKESWISKESSINETIGAVNNDVTRLWAQVVELEESKRSLLQEKQQLMDNIAGMQSQIQDHEKTISSTNNEFAKLALDNENLKAQIEAAAVLVEKLIIENADLVEKVNELYIELYQGKGEVRHTFALRTDPLVEIMDSVDVAHALPECSENMSARRKHLESLQVDPTKHDRSNGSKLNGENLTAVPSASESCESAEIVQIPLDDVAIRDPELQTLNNDENPTASLSDAPLTGAPFRLVSYFAGYISGADLVEKKSANSV